MSGHCPAGVDREIRRLLRRGRSLSGTVPSTGHELLWSALADASEGGRRFRPALLLTAHEALGGTRHEAALQVAAAVEILHTAFVVQDDVIDGDQVRRGAPSLPAAVAARAGREGAPEQAARHLGEVAGILAGDLGLVTAMRAVAGCSAPAPVVSSLLDLVESSMHASATGELDDVRLPLHPADRPESMQEALSVAELKTAVYSFQLPLHAAGLLADASPARLEALDAIGAMLGIGFQLVDDLLGVFGDENLTGKSTLGDLREGKRTALVAHAARTAQWPRLRPLLGRAELTEDGAHSARELLTASGSRAWVEDLARWHLAGAVDVAARHDLPPALRSALTDLTAEILAGLDMLLPSAEASADRAGSGPASSADGCGHLVRQRATA
jgi:geranylgeranyl diphosphate synthase type II